MLFASKPAGKPTTSRLTLLAASLAAPLGVISNFAISLLMLAFGIVKLLPDSPVNAPASADLLRLSTGGVIEAPWGVYLVGVLQVALGLGLLIPSARAVASLGCLVSAAAVAVGGFSHWSELNSSRGLNEVGIALILLFVLLLAGAALGARAAARRLDVAR